MNIQKIFTDLFALIQRHYSRHIGSRNTHIKIALLLITLTFFSFLFLDIRIFKLFMLMRLIKPVDFLVGFASGLTLIYIVVSVMVFLNRRENQISIVAKMLGFMLIGAFIMLLLKFFIARPHPFDSISTSYFNYQTIGSSFPDTSGLGFVMVPALWKLWKYDLLFVLVPLVLHAASKVYLGQCYLSDTLAGTAIGYYLGYYAFRKML